jgi:3-oxoadipate enol-lactonase
VNLAAVARRHYTVCVNFTSNDAQLSYTITGQGPDVVLLHPTPCDHRFWQVVVGSLSGRYRVILPDLRGHGQSEAGNGPITVAKLGADVERLLDVLGIQRALFAGCSIGGYTLYELWREAPSRIGALAFCCSKPQADTDVNRAKRDEWIRKIRERGTADFIESMLESLIGPTARQRAPEKIADAREMMQAMRPEAVIAVQQGLAARPDSVETARGIHVPCFVLGGGEDTSSTPADMKLLAESIRSTGYGAEFTLLRDAGHFAPWEQPQMVGRLLRRFFDSVIE